MKEETRRAIAHVAAARNQLRGAFDDFTAMGRAVILTSLAAATMHMIMTLPHIFPGQGRDCFIMVSAPKLHST